MSNNPKHADPHPFAPVDMQVSISMKAKTTDGGTVFSIALKNPTTGSVTTKDLDGGTKVPGNPGAALFPDRVQIPDKPNYRTFRLDQHPTIPVTTVEHPDAGGFSLVTLVIILTSSGPRPGNYTATEQKDMRTVAMDTPPVNISAAEGKIVAQPIKDSTNTQLLITFKIKLS